MRNLDFALAFYPTAPKDDRSTKPVVTDILQVRVIESKGAEDMMVLKNQTRYNGCSEMMNASKLHECDWLERPPTFFGGTPLRLWRSQMVEHPISASRAESQDRDTGSGRGSEQDGCTRST